MNNNPDPETINIIYNEISRQYDLVLAALDGLSNKAIGIIAFNGTLLSLSSLSVVQLVKNSLLIQELFIVGIVISYALILISTLFSIIAYTVINVNSIHPKKLHSNYYLSEKLKVVDQLCSNIADDTEKNREKLNQKGKYINLSLIFAFLGMLLVSISLIYGFFA